MEKVIYLVRHCEATGQSPDAELTAEGREQALALAEFFKDKQVNQIISSPYNRAIQSIMPTAEEKELDLFVHKNLRERALSKEHLVDWEEKLKESFKDFHKKLPGGESNSEATERFLPILDDIKLGSNKTTILVTHGNLMTLILHLFNSNYGFNDWKNLTNPDVYKIEIGKNNQLERIW
ncbi:histidine phosphatase family protein [Filobacillus milosensis]|uniref:Histidine phosphatase family protein n=1 Tax=Filobacillus milosensis TaxID=94137 RepID=A0A4Y8IL25_9BACI|nr:histidine phosphatase family protein [Filobacillus milosensis]TFB21788.1 histidine phosphatase family protein [Filobacillus milosensis]